MTTEQQFVLFPLGEKRFALPAERVTELARPDSLQTFPHTSKLMAGVLVRRGGIIPVCDIAQVLAPPNPPARKFYLIAECRHEGGIELTAIPVSGECELVSAEAVARPAGGMPAYVQSLLSLPGEIVEVLQLEPLMEDRR